MSGQDMATDVVAHVTESCCCASSAPVTVVAMNVPSYIPPKAPTTTLTLASDNEGVRVRLTLSVTTSGSRIAPGLEMEDCGVCVFCLDKPKYGGPGTKRQKCELKQNEANHATRMPAGVRVWTTLHIVKQSEYDQIRSFEEMPLPTLVLEAVATKGSLPVVWAYRRKRRARTLPPAYVLMYYCEGRIPLDRSELANSRQRYFENRRNPEAVRCGEKRRNPGATKVAREKRLQYIWEQQQQQQQQQQELISANAWPSSVQHQQHQQQYEHQQYEHQQYEHQQYDQYLPLQHQQQLYDPVPMQVPTAWVASDPSLPTYYSPAPVVHIHMPPPPPAPPMQSVAMPMYHAPVLPSQPLGRRIKKRPSPQATGLALSPDQYSMHSPTVPGMETESWMLDQHAAQHGAPTPGGVSAAPSQRRKRSKPDAAQESASRDNGESNAMSNRTLDTMLQRLQGQLPQHTYEQVLELVRDVQVRRRQLSRSEFLECFQAICAGAPQPN